MRRLALLVLPAITLFACTGEPERAMNPVPMMTASNLGEPLPQPEEPATPAETPTPTPTPTPRTHRATKLPRGMPRTFCALTAGGDLVQGSSATGGVTRLIATRARLAKEPWRSCPSPRRRTVYFVKRVGESCFEVWSLRTSTGRRSRIGRGDSLALSPDGKRLAYLDYGNCGSKAIRLVVRNLSTGRERVWKASYTVDETDGGMGELTWLDNRRLLYDGCGVDSCCTFMVDTAKRCDCLEGQAFGPEKMGGQDLMGTASHPLVRGRLGTVLMAVYDQDQRIGMIEYDWRRKTARDFPKLDVVDSDRSGRFLLYFDERNELFAWYDGKSIRIGPGYASAEW